MTWWGSPFFLGLAQTGTTPISRADSARLSAEVQKAWREKDYSYALRSMTLLREAYPDNENLLYNQGLLWMESGQWNEAYASFKNLYSRNPYFPGLGIQLAFTAIRLGQPEEARSFLREAPAPGSPETPEYYRALGHLALLEKDTEKALAAFKKSLTAWPENPSVYLDLARIYMILNDTLEFQRALEGATLFGGSTTARDLLEALMRGKLNQGEKALPILDKKVPPSFPMASSWFGYKAWLLCSLGRWQEALSVVHELLKLPHGPTPQTLAFSGAVKTMLGDLEGALRDLASAIEMQPDLGIAWLNKGVVYARMNSITEACACWKKAARLNVPLADTYIQFQCF
ncbi:MAG: tetratricopeptide repeat protein [Flavobacteriales bacterium]|nr:tetratricopeptide repeat protein [Flavobacteriales bacterium]MDW8432085.1 tetratricopeptide repeat protein [Flavobacteriales bacterium]